MSLHPEHLTNRGFVIFVKHLDFSQFFLLTLSYDAIHFLGKFLFHSPVICQFFLQFSNMLFFLFLLLEPIRLRRISNFCGSSLVASVKPACSFLLVCPSEILLVFRVDEALEELLKLALISDMIIFGTTGVLFGLEAGFDAS